jgi:hypothetical protein
MKNRIAFIDLFQIYLSKFSKGTLNRPWNPRDNWELAIIWDMIEDHSVFGGHASESCDLWLRFLKSLIFVFLQSIMLIHKPLGCSAIHSFMCTSDYPCGSVKYKIFRNYNIELK